MKISSASFLQDRRVVATAFVVGLLLLGCGVFLAARKILLFDMWPYGTDIEVYLHAAQSVQNGTTPYLPGRVGLDPYPYPPFFAEALVPLTHILGFGRGWMIWAFSGLACLLASLFIMLRCFSPKIPVGYILLIGGAFSTSHIVRNEIFHGQINFLMALLVVLGILFWVRQRNVAASIVWSLAIVTKPFLGLLVLFLARKRDYRTMILTLVGSGLIFLGSFYFAFHDPIHVFNDWRTATAWHTGIPNVARPDNQSFYGFFVRLFISTRFSAAWFENAALPKILMIPVIAVAAIAFLRSVSRERTTSATSGGARTLLEVAITLGLFMACGPFMENDHVFVLLPGLFGAILICIAKDVDDRWLFASALWLLAFINLFLPFSVGQFVPPSWPRLEGLMILRSIHYGLIFFLAAAYSGLLLRSTASSEIDETRTSNAPTRQKPNLKPVDIRSGI